MKPFSELSESTTLARDERRVGAHCAAEGVSYNVWAPDFRSLNVLVQRDGRTTRIELERDEEGYWRGWDREGRSGDLYQFETPDGLKLPDVASRFQPQGVHGPSEVIDPEAYVWKSVDWHRPRWTGQSIYELHLGTFTPEGTFRAAIQELDYIVKLGAEAIQIMPVGDFPGARNWGYDGVAIYAPARCYGRPDDFRALVDAAHARGLIVILDVVYNHLGPVGNYLPAYSKDYFRTDRPTPWGAALNLDGPRNLAVRNFIGGNAVYWLDEFRIDGLRIDATHAIPDSTDPHLLATIAEAVHARGGFVIAEDDRNSVTLLNDRALGGYGFDAAWSDDFHHQLRVWLTGTRESYFAAYDGKATDVADTLRHGWTYRGQVFPFWKGKTRGGACGHLSTSAFVLCIENHDQVGNRACGERLEHLVTPAQYRAASLLLCLNPYVPMLFMGQEWAASSPFMFFTDHAGEHGKLVSAGRRREFEESGLNQGGVGDFPDPQEESTFRDSKLKWDELEERDHHGVLALYQAALTLRRDELTESVRRRDRWEVQAVGGIIALWYEFESFYWLLLVGLSADGGPISDADILHPAKAGAWRPVLSSEEERFGGNQNEAPAVGAFRGPAAVLYQAQKEAADVID